MQLKLDTLRHWISPICNCGCWQNTLSNWIFIIILFVREIVFIRVFFFAVKLIRCWHTQITYTHTVYTMKILCALGLFVTLASAGKFRKLIQLVFYSTSIPPPPPPSTTKWTIMCQFSHFHSILNLVFAYLHLCFGNLSFHLCNQDAETEKILWQRNHLIFKEFH